MEQAAGEASHLAISVKPLPTGLVPGWYNQYPAFTWAVNATCVPREYGCTTSNKPTLGAKRHDGDADPSTERRFSTALL